MRHFARSIFVVGAVVATYAPAVFGGVISFDSQAEFSSIQGSGNWTYGYYATSGDSNTFVQFTNFNPVLYPGGAWTESAAFPPWTLLQQAGGHGNGTNSVGGVHDAVRRWTSGGVGTLNILGDYAMIDPGQTSVSVMVDGVQIWAGLPVYNSPQTFSVASAVNVNSRVDFVINSFGEDYNDSTRFTATGSIGAAPASVPGPLPVLGAAVALGWSRRLRARIRACKEE